jgi:hypothetical protein
MHCYFKIRESPKGRPISTRDVAHDLTLQEQDTIAKIALAVAARDPSIWIVSLTVEITADYDVLEAAQAAKPTGDA